MREFGREIDRLTVVTDAERIQKTERKFTVAGVEAYTGLPACDDATRLRAAWRARTRPFASCLRHAPLSRGPANTCTPIPPWAPACRAMSMARAPCRLPRRALWRSSSKSPRTSRPRFKRCARLARLPRFKFSCPRTSGSLPCLDPSLSASASSFMS